MYEVANVVFPNRLLCVWLLRRC